MRKTLIIILSCLSFLGWAQTSPITEEAALQKVLAEPDKKEVAAVLKEVRQRDLTPRKIVMEDTVDLANGNRLYVISHAVQGRKHYGAVIVPGNSKTKLPVVVFTTGGDGIHKEFFLEQDFNHKAVQFPSFLGADLDKRYVVVVPSFRGQELIIGKKKYQSEGNVSDAFDGAATDALALLNVALKTFSITDKNKIAFYGGSRGGAVALLASARDQRVKKVVVVAAPTDLRLLNELFPPQFKILFINDLLAGTITTEEARRKFIASSPIYFSDQLPPVQLHQDTGDPFVIPAFAEKLIAKMNAEGKTITPYYYNEQIHGFWEDENFWKRVTAFLDQH